MKPLHSLILEDSQDDTDLLLQKLQRSHHPTAFIRNLWATVLPSLKPKVFAQTAASCVFFVGIMVLLGWIFDIATLKSILPAWPKMSPLAMLAFLLAAISLWCAASEKLSARNESRQKILQRLIKAPHSISHYQLIPNTEVFHER